MKRARGDRELLLEVGFAGIGLGILGGLGMLLLGRLLGNAQRGTRHAEAPPSAGSVPFGRHQHLSPSPR